MDDYQESSVDERYVCPITGLKQWELEILRTSWLQIVGVRNARIVETATSLVLWMFHNIPNIQQRMALVVTNRDNRSMLYCDGVFLFHALAVIQSLHRIVHVSHNPEVLEKELRRIIAIHVNCNPTVGIEYFSHFRRKFHVLLLERLKTTIDDERIRVWNVLLNKLCYLLYEEEFNLNESKARGRCCSIL
ncbi:globin-like [Physella acuta]|uniref:globin-like n=1 Tax=Physella acuta TaxID=109671 RepID=UPI0027DD550C|nr:globin-like [Physella acuta]